MGIIAWLVLGLIAGFIASKIVNHTGSGVIMDIVLGVIGAFVGGFLFSFFGHSGVTGFNLYSALVAIVVLRRRSSSITWSPGDAEYSRRLNAISPSWRGSEGSGFAGALSLLRTKWNLTRRRRRHRLAPIVLS